MAAVTNALALPPGNTFETALGKMLSLGKLPDLGLTWLYRFFSPASLFANGEQGAWYDPSDLSTLYQDAAGTTPVTAVEQPVGLMLDKSKGLVLGPELVVNGGFETNITGWVVGNAGRSTLAWADGKLRITRVNAGDTYPNARTTLTGLTVGRIYKIVSATNNPFGIEAYHAITSLESSIVRTTLASKTMECVFTATDTSHTLDVGIWFTSGSAGQYVEFDNISVRELPGNHAYQTTATSRPVLKARVNLLEQTQSFDNAYWTKVNATISANTIAAPDGTLTVDKLVGNNASSSSSFQRQVVALTSGSSHTFSISVKTDGVVPFVQLIYLEGANLYRAWFNLTTGATGTTVGSFVNPVAVSEGDGWFRISASVTLTGVAPFFIVANSSGDNVNGYTGDGTSGIYIWGASLVPANQADLPYQRVNTATDYDTTNFPLYLRCDGIDDGMVTGTITPGTDKAQVFAGVRKLSDAAQGTIAELGDATGNNYFSLASSTSGATNYRFASLGTVFSNAASSAVFTAPITNIVTGIGDISGDRATLRLNGTQAAQSTADQGTGNYLAYPLYLFRRGGTSLPFNGNFYGGIIRFGDNLPIETIEQTEAWMAAKTGVTL